VFRDSGVVTWRVVDKFLDVVLDEVDLGEDLVGGCGPGEGFRSLSQAVM
jgi:hypothetical protein